MVYDAILNGFGVKAAENKSHSENGNFKHGLVKRFQPSRKLFVETSWHTGG